MREPKDFVHVFLDGLDGPLCDQLIFLASLPSGLIDTDWRRCSQTPITGETLTSFKRALRPLVSRYRTICSTLNFCTMLEKPNVLGYETGNGDKPHHFHEHADSWNMATATRQISIIAYLNDVRQGGETVFPALDLSVRPRRGSVLMFPSSWAFHHLAREPISWRKFVAVSWLHFGGEGHQVTVSPLESD